MKKRQTTKQQVKSRLVRDPATGLIITRGLANGPTVTSDDVRALLGESRTKSPPRVPTDAEKRKALDTILRVFRPDPVVLLRIMKRYIDERIHGRLPAGERQCAVRVLRVLTRAGEALGSEVAGNRWITTPQQALGGRAPLALLESEEGAEEVLNVLGAVGAPARPSL